MTIKEYVFINLLKLAKRVSTKDYRHHRPLDIIKVRKDLLGAHTIMSHMESEMKGVFITDEFLNGIPCFHTRLPTDTKRTIFYVHGGGYIFDMRNRSNPASLAMACNANLWGPEYRLAPEHPHPAALDDVYQAYLGLLARGVLAKDIIVVGDSSGGGLALAMLFRIRDEKMPLPTAAVIMSPWTDLALTGESLVSRAKIDPLLSPDVLEEIAEFILGSHSPLDPYISPLYGNFEGLPPMMVFVGGREILFDDARRMVETAQKHGVNATLDTEEQMIHIYPIFNRVFPEGKYALRRMANFVNKHHK